MQAFEPLSVTSFYRFCDFPEDVLPAIHATLHKEASSRNILGLLIVAAEGCNGTVCGTSSAICEFKEILQRIFSLELDDFKDSSCSVRPFRRLRIDIRDEIVTAGLRFDPARCAAQSRLTPREWQEELLHGKDFTLLDVRNFYETQLGKFEGALDPKIPDFTSFAEYLSTAQFPKDRKLLIYCTGGIRCEKAYIELIEQGFTNVYQLKGGILRYLEQFPHSLFSGECFVFDHRVALTQDLKPSNTYKLCPHCGNPADEKILCSKCAKETVVCKACIKEQRRRTCSKNCAYHLR